METCFDHLVTGSGNRCFDCLNWCGRCLSGHRFKIAADSACEDFKDRAGKGDEVKQ